MKGRLGALTALVLGVLLIAGGLGVKFVFLPSQAQWPDDVDSTRYYQGTLATMLDAQALEDMDLLNLFVEDVPVTVERHATTELVEGGKALVREQGKMLGPTGEQIPPSTDYWYTIDRKSTEAIPNFTDNPTVKARQGLVISFPVGTEARDYQGWSEDYQALVTLEYVGVEDHEGMRTYHFRSSSGPRPVVDRSLLEGYPTALPKGLVSALAPQLGLPPELLVQLGQLLPALPDPVPFDYLYQYETGYWVEPTTGVLIDYTKGEQYLIALVTDTFPGGLLPVGPVFDLSYEQTDASIQDAIDDAEEAKGLINLFGTIIPYGAIGLGALLLLGGGYLAARKRS